MMKNKVALVTGGSSGIGRASAIALSNKGVKVIIASRNEMRGNEVVSSLKEKGNDAMWIQTDVSKYSQIQELFEKIIDNYGSLDYAFNNGGNGGMGGLLAEIEEKDWDTTIDGYLKSTWMCMKFELQEMLHKGSGVIINNSSVDGLRGFSWDPVYSAAKHGVIGLTKSAALQYANKNIRINAICPGWIQTPPIDRILERDPAAEKGMLFHQPIGRFGTAEEVAHFVVWLCSDEASFMTGAALPIDGGYTAI
ncbi:MAG: SDR family oxidoreductase [Candidatus Kariarchaeaceae archaeon]|jgi:NAD(P)-dependent dehydrogenase (short-subunit alcohol dehydrogenase family)